MQHDEENNPKHWIWGIFYYNPGDKRLILPKRLPYFGLTVNFASPYAIPLIIGSIVLLVLMTQVLGYLFH
ncbi:MAG TPA: hypothetical protein PLQ93_07455 [Bacteroidia bacterium]|nr:hypothetical protein [Bacteroidia bacterium]